MKQLFIGLCAFFLVLSLTACGGQTATSSSPAVASQTNPERPAVAPAAEAAGTDTASQTIQLVTAEGNTILFALNDSPAADGLYHQLPLEIWVEDYAGAEKIFYPPEELPTEDTPLAKGPAGTLSYYAPWGNVAIFYGECGGASGLYELGQAVSGEEYLTELTGEVEILAVSDAAPTES